MKEELLDFYRKHKIVIWVIGVFITLLFICSIINILYSITQVFFLNKKIDNFGLIGDSAGLLNSIFSGLALLGVIITIYLQGKELKQTRDELRGQKEQFEIQNKTLKRQQFENTFFNMLKTQENIVSNLEIGHQTHINSFYYSGRRTFEQLFYNLRDKMKGNQQVFNKGDKKINEEIVKIYSSIDSLKMLDHYFRHIYRIVKFVDKTDFSFCLDEKDKNKNEEEKNNKIENEKYEYISILRAALSPYEFVLLFYNGLGYDKMKDFIEHYKILDNLRIELLCNKNDILLYNKSAYGEETQKYYDKLLDNIEERIKNCLTKT
ncbi:putative phage abortive infection protein [Candidatus Ruminimicrobiellum ovillum]|uniref:putative phage abortive infection protein n=1 Tax=Candidatus Ruminimicrobiellum ovillum TaxID=1947927 RepID=UPI00355A07C4